MCTYAKMKTILIFTLCGIVMTCSEAYENDVSLLEGRMIGGNDLPNEFAKPKILFGIAIDNEHICNGVVSEMDTGVSTAKCALKIRKALEDKKDVKIWYGGDRGQHKSWTRIHDANVYRTDSYTTRGKIPEFYDLSLDVDIGLIALKTPFESDKVSHDPVFGCSVVRIENELLVMSRDSSGKKECATSPSQASSSTVPAEYSKPIKTLTVLQIDSPEYYERMNIPPNVRCYLRNFRYIYPKDNEARLEETDIGSPVMQAVGKGWAIGIVAHIFGDGSGALVALFRNVFFVDGLYELKRP